MCTYGLTEGSLLNHSYMPGMYGSISSQYAADGAYAVLLHRVLAAADMASIMTPPLTPTDPNKGPLRTTCLDKDLLGNPFGRAFSYMNRRPDSS